MNTMSENKTNNVIAKSDRSYLESELAIDKEVLQKFSTVDSECGSETLNMGRGGNPFDNWTDSHRK